MNYRKIAKSTIEHAAEQNGHRATGQSPNGDIPNTGERYLPRITTPNAEWCATGYEHVHRYLLASHYCTDLLVLDVASGEGYGAMMLARSARHVKGLDIDPTSVEHARSRYGTANLEFEVADAEHLVLEPASFDLVVSFETIEHILAQEAFLDAVKAALTPGGILIISTPNPVVYTDEGDYHNPFHRRELTYAEFMQILRSRFKQVQVYGQQVFAGSLIAPDENGEALRAEAPCRIETVTFDGETLGYSRPSGGALLPRYYVAICSDSQAVDVPPSVMLDSENALVREAIRDLGRLDQGRRDLDHASTLLQERDLQLQERDLQLEEAQAALTESQEDSVDRSLRYLSELQRMQTELRDAAESSARYHDEVQRLTSDLNVVYSTKAWRLTQAYWRAAGQGIPAVVSFGMKAGISLPAAIGKAWYRHAIVAPRTYQLVKASGLFDEGWYRATYPDVQAADALQHYLAYGRDEGRSPGPLFDAKFYLQRHPDIAAGGLNPLLHYVMWGAGEGREIRSVGLEYGEVENIPIKLVGTPVLPGSVAVVIHSFVPEVFDEMCPYLHNIPGEFTLYVSVPTPEKRREVLASLKRHGITAKAEVRLCQNRGRHFGPFLSEFSADVLRHDVLLHLHTKTSVHLGNNQADTWRRHLLQALIANKQVVRTTLEMFAQQTDIGVIYSRTVSFLPYYSHQWMSNSSEGSRLFSRLGIEDYTREGLFDFPVGGMFWARVDALRPLFEARFTYEDFPPEEGQLDGTLQHAVERCIVEVAKSRGFGYVEVDYPRGVMRRNHGSKNLDTYVHHSQSELLHNIRAADLVSFDIFDTLVLSPSRSTDAVLRYIGHIMSQRHPGAADFFERRTAAEVAAREAKGFLEDVDIHEIYARFPASATWPEAVIGVARDLEVETEGRIARPRECAVEAVHFARDLGKRVIALADTPMPRSLVEGLLEAAGLAGCFDQIYLSSERRARKDRGDLWRLVLDEEKVSPSRWLHVGDDELSDLVKPGDLGLGILHLMRPANLAKLRGYDPPYKRNANLWGTDLLMGLVVNRIASDPLLDGKPYRPVVFESPEDVGYTTFGPLVFAYTKWLVRHPAMRNVQKVFFLSQQGFLLKRVYDMIREHVEKDSLPEAEYLLASPKMALSAMQGVTFSPEAILKENAEFRGTLADLLRIRLGLDIPPELPADEVQVRLPEDADVALAGIYALEDQVVAHGAKQLELYREYLRSVGMSPDIPAALADAGYRGIIQHYLQASLGQEFAGFYMSKVVGTRELVGSGDRAYGCFVKDALEDPVQTPVLKYQSLVEAVFSGPHGQLDTFTAAGDGVEPVFEREVRSESDRDVMSRIQDGIIDYCEDLLQAYGPEILDVPIDLREVQEPLRVLGERGSRGSVEVERALGLEAGAVGSSLPNLLVSRRHRVRGGERAFGQVTAD